MNTSIFRHSLIVRSVPWAIVVWTAIIVYLTMFPSDKLIEVKLFKYDKIGHFVIFGGWTFLLGLLQLLTFNRIERPLYPIVLAGIGFGALIEIAQYLLPYERYSSWGDLLANTLGCLLALLVLVAIKRNLRNHQPGRYTYQHR
jgi:VanZ family protein